MTIINEFIIAFLGAFAALNTGITATIVSSGTFGVTLLFSIGEKKLFRFYFNAGHMKKVDNTVLCALPEIWQIDLLAGRDEADIPEDENLCEYFLKKPIGEQLTGNEQFLSNWASPVDMWYYEDMDAADDALVAHLASEEGDGKDVCGIDEGLVAVADAAKQIKNAIHTFIIDRACGGSGYGTLCHFMNELYNTNSDN